LRQSNFSGSKYTVTIPKDFKEFITLLNARGVDYAVVGGYAVALHGAPRFTGDIDILVAPTPHNARSVMTVLADFGFSDLKVSADDFLEPDRVIQLGVPPLRIDLLTSIDGVDWNDVKHGLVQVTTDNVEVRLIGRADLIKNKRASGRAKDLADLEALGDA
jgi:Nucleotidyltransferase of unknown function (DUF6036)